MNDGQLTTHPEPDPAPFKIHLLTRAGRVMRARSEPVLPLLPDRREVVICGEVFDRLRYGRQHKTEAVLFALDLVPP